MLKELVKDFCKENSDKYDFVENIVEGLSEDKPCVGIVVKPDHSYMQMLMELTSYLDAHEFDDTDFELEAPAIEELGENTVVYFPNIK